MLAIYNGSLLPGHKVVTKPSRNPGHPKEKAEVLRAKAPVFLPLHLSITLNSRKSFNGIQQVSDHREFNACLVKRKAWMLRPPCN